jgi:large subunit ribosomal protein L4
MLEVPIYNMNGDKINTLEVDEALFGSTVNVDLLKQAVVIYHAHQHRCTSATKSRGMVSGSTKKLFRQKGTGNARRGNIRTNVLRGGGVAFAKVALNPLRKTLPRKMRRAALNSALLAKMLGQDLLVLDGLKMDQPQTKVMAEVMKKLNINRSCLLALQDRDQNVYLSSRNLKDVTVRIAEELNAFEVANRQKMVVTTEAMQALMSQEAGQ